MCCQKYKTDKLIKLYIYSFFCLFFFIILGFTITGTILTSRQLNTDLCLLTKIISDNNSTISGICLINDSSTPCYGKYENKIFTINNDYLCWQESDITIISKDKRTIDPAFILFIILNVFIFFRIVTLSVKIYEKEKKYRKYDNIESIDIF